MISIKLRNIAETLTAISASRPATPIECLSLALTLRSIANQADMMETAAIPREKRELTVIIGGKASS